MAAGQGSNNNTPGYLSNLPVVSEPRCNICKSAARKRVDRLLAAGFSNAAVAEELQLTEDDFKGKELDTIRKNVERHAKRHVNVRERAIKSIIERRAKEEGILVDEVAENLATARGVYDLIIQKGTEQLANPDAKVRYADVIEAAKMLEEAKRQEYTHELERYQRQVWAISQALKEYEADEDKLRRIVTRAKELFENPQLEIEAPIQQRALKHE